MLMADYKPSSFLRIESVGASCVRCLVALSLFSQSIHCGSCQEIFKKLQNPLLEANSVGS